MGKEESEGRRGKERNKKCNTGLYDACCLVALATIYQPENTFKGTQHNF